MKREIKFRALKDDHSDFRFVYGNLIYDKDIPRIQENNFKHLFTTCIKGTDGQYTGMKDRNGKDVYEGDVCEFYFCDYDSLMFVGLAYVNNNVVGGGWRIIRCDNVHPDIPEISGEECLDSTSFWNDDFEIIGNIHQNPEYLK